ncbi:protein eva-1 homolog C-like [Polyodon spathula]|uniref:protein eva-1 homolog C-like n=1 Tax=Polyodon spathula TaxID=7913 RepID=UPI001B7DEE0A|nr:protein eva-1 homolog C-like [Polyodon spathula]
MIESKAGDSNMNSWGQKAALLHIFYYLLLIWTKEISALVDFSGYLSRILQNHSAHACEGEQLNLQCPRHSTVSVLSAFYGRNEPSSHMCPNNSRPVETEENQNCSSFTALQKVLAECQARRACQLPVNNNVFGLDPCPGVTKYLLVSYKCKPTEHRTKVGCEGGQLELQCKDPTVINIYSAVYGRWQDENEVCSLDGKLPQFECLFHGAVEFVSKMCYAKQRCNIMVNNHHFKDPCLPGVRKYLRIIYKCVPETLLKEVDLSLSKLIPSLKQNHENGIILQPKGSRLPDNNSILVSNSLAVYAYIKDHPERTAVLFVCSVCMGLFVTLCALVFRVSCRKELQTHCRGRLLHSRDSKWEEDTNDTNNDGSSDSCDMNAIFKTAAIDLDPAEEAELAERIERREQIIQEIWMNSCLDGTIIRSINQYY